MLDTLSMIKLSYLYLFVALGQTAVAIDKTAVLEKINGYRRSHQAPDVTWSDTISSSVSQPWTDHLAATKTFEHNPDSLDYGENLAMSGPSNDLTKAVENAIVMWYSEVNKYDFDNPGYAPNTGHFTQLVWVNTKRIGVGVTVGSSSEVYVVMNYDPPGNYLGDFVGNVLPLLSPEPSPSPVPSPYLEPSPEPSPELSPPPQLINIDDLVDSSVTPSINYILFGSAVVAGVLLI